VREVGSVVAVALVAACASGVEGSMLTTFGVSSVTTTGTDATTTDTSTAGDTGPMGSGSGSTGSGTATPDDSATSSSTSSDTGAMAECDAALETFAVDPAWTVIGLPDGGTVFGWAATAYAGGDAGEIGGTLQRAGTDHRYADTALSVESGDCVAAQGRLVVSSEDPDYNAIVSFGHFSTTGGGPEIGFSFGESDNSQVRVFLVAGSVSEQVFLLDAGTAHSWSYAYDPTSGMMTLAIDGLGSESRPVMPADVAGIESIDAFGMFKTPHDTPELYPGLLEVYLDEISYTR
jgi:hypothetical protein